MLSLFTINWVYKQVPAIFLAEFAKAIYIDLIPWCIVMGHLRGVIFCHSTAELYRPSEAKAYKVRGGDGGGKSQ